MRGWYAVWKMERQPSCTLQLLRLSLRRRIVVGSQRLLKITCRPAHDGHKSYAPASLWAPPASISTLITR